MKTIEIKNNTGKKQWCDPLMLDEKTMKVTKKDIKILKENVWFNHLKEEKLIEIKNAK